MFIPRLLIIIGLSTQLYGMKNEIAWPLYLKIKHTPYKQLQRCSYNPDAIGAIINFAEKTQDRFTMAKLLYVCFPEEVIKEYIAPRLAQYITTQYKNDLISHAFPWTPSLGSSNSRSHTFETKMINYTKDTILIHHDGTYTTAPDIGCEYAMWKAGRCKKTSPEQKKTIYHKISTDKSMCLSFKENQNKEFYIHKKNNDSIRVCCEEPVSHSVFSNDNKLIAFGFLKQPYSMIIDLKTKKCECFNWNYSTNALCSAHHSPMFAIGLNTECFNNNLVLIKKQDNNFENTYLDKLNGMILSIEFSPDDSQLLACSYRQENEPSYFLTLYNTSNYDGTLISSTQKNISKAFFICNGKRIIAMQKDGHFAILNGLTGESIKKYGRDCLAPELTIWSNKNNLIITAINNEIQFFSSETGQWLGEASGFSSKITEIGLPTDEKSIIILQKGKDDACQLQLYNQEQRDYFDFIEEHI